MQFIEYNIIYVCVCVCVCVSHECVIGIGMYMYSVLNVYLIKCAEPVKSWDHLCRILYIRLD